MSSKVKILKAYHGDSIIVETIDDNGNPFIILIDGGTVQTFKNELKKEISNYTKIDLIILTHIDSDHIGGLLQLMKSDIGEKIEFKKMVINAANLKSISKGTQISYGQGLKLEEIIYEKYPNIKLITDITTDFDFQLFELPKGLEIEILSPNRKALDALYKNWTRVDLIKEQHTNTQISSSKVHQTKGFDILLQDLAFQSDDAKTIESDILNASSIAFTLKTPDFYGLFLGDSHAKIVCEAFKKKGWTAPILFDFIKLSHHGSKNNISSELLTYVQTETFIVSTNGGSADTKHPDRKTLAKVVCSPKRIHQTINFYFNYPLSDVESKTGKLVSEDEMETYNFQMVNQNIFIYP